MIVKNIFLVCWESVNNNCSNINFNPILIFFFFWFNNVVHMLKTSYISLFHNIYSNSFPIYCEIINLIVENGFIVSIRL